MTATTQTTDNLYALRNSLIAAEKSVEQLLLTNNQVALGTAADVTINAAAVLANGTSNLASKLITSGAQVVCPAPSGTRTTGYVFTVVNGVITAAVGY